MTTTEPREIAPELDLQMVLSQPLPERVITNLYFDPSKSVDVDMTDRQPPNRKCT